MGEDGKRLYFTNRQRRSQLNFDPKDIDPLDWWKGSWSYRIVSWIIERGWESDNLRNYSRLLFSIPCNCRMRTALLLLFTINIPSSVFHRVVHSIFLETGLDITRYLKCIYVYQTQKAFKGTVKGTTFETAPALAQPRMLTVISTEPLGCQRQVLLPPFDFETSEASRHDLTIMRWWRLFPFCWIEVKSQRWMEISEQLESSVGIDIAALSGRLERWLSLYWMFFFFFSGFLVTGLTPRVLDLRFFLIAQQFRNPSCDFNNSGNQHILRYPLPRDESDAYSQICRRDLVW